MYYICVFVTVRWELSEDRSISNSWNNMYDNMLKYIMAYNFSTLRMIGWQMNNETEGIWKEAVVSESRIQLKSSIKVADIPAKIRMEHLHYRSLDLYVYMIS
jgi:hypothetical protein